MTVIADAVTAVARARLLRRAEQTSAGLDPVEPVVRHHRKRRRRSWAHVGRQPVLVRTCNQFSTISFKQLPNKPTTMSRKFFGKMEKSKKYSNLQKCL